MTTNRVPSKMFRVITIAMQVLLSHWRRNPLQLATFIGGLALATALWSGVQAINSEARASYDAAAATLGEGQFDQLLPREGDTIALATYVKLRRNGWLVSPVLEGTINDVRLIGVEPLTAPGGLQSLTQNNEATIQDALGQGMVFANAETASKLNIEAPVNIDASIANGVAIADISAVQDILGNDDLTRLLVAKTQSANRAELSEIAPELRLQPSMQTADLGEMTASFHLNLTAFGLLSFAVGIFIVHSTIGLAFEQRRGAISTLRALGVPLKATVLATILEIALLALVGATLGILLGYVIAALLLPDVAATLRGLYGAEVSGTLQLRAEWWASGIAIALIGTAFAMSGKLVQIARMPILASGRRQAWVLEAGRMRGLQALSGVALFIIGGFLLWLGKGLFAGFAMLGCLLISAALVLPFLLDKGTKFAKNRAHEIIPQWFWADTRQQIPGLSLALMALLLAVTANIGVSTMVSSFRVTFEEFLDQRLAPELYVYVENPSDSMMVEAALAAKAEEVLPLYTQKRSVAGLPVEIHGITAGPTYRENWQFIAAEANIWDRLSAGEVIIANEQFARRSGYWTGDQVTMEGRTLHLAGIVADYGNPLGQITLGQNLYRQLYPEDIALRFGARTDNHEALKQAVQNESGLPDSAFINQAALKSFSLNVFERTFTVTAALNVLTLSVAGFALFTSLLTLADLRVPQLAPVWALGLTRRALAKLEIWRTLALAAMVCLLALPLGLALAWILLSVINVEAFGWRLPMFLFPFDYAKLWVYALIAAILAALWPAIRLARIAPNTLLKVFANER